jgi:ATP-dependent DNA ligase
MREFVGFATMSFTCLPTRNDAARLKNGLERSLPRSTERLRLPFRKTTGCDTDVNGDPDSPSRVHWVQPEMVAEVSYVEWTPDGLLRHVVYLGKRQDKLAIEVRRSRPDAREP